MSMKIFVPVSDELLDRRGAECGRLVPFNPEFLESNARAGTKPANWISDSDYLSACKRLWQSEERELYGA